MDVRGSAVVSMVCGFRVNFRGREWVGQGTGVCGVRDVWWWVFGEGVETNPTIAFARAKAIMGHPDGTCLLVAVGDQQ